jgi:hypothetical protein
MSIKFANLLFSNLRLVTISFVLAYSLIGLTEEPSHLSTHLHDSVSVSKALDSLRTAVSPRPIGPSPTPLPPSTEINELIQPRGQVNEWTAFGLALMDLASLPDVNLILEIGTYFGGGSSLCIAKALKAKGKGRLVTIESFEEPFAYASATLRGYPVELILGTTVSPQDFPTPEEVKRSGATFESSEEDWIHFLNQERIKSGEYPLPLLESLCKDRPFDAVLIDGAEFSGPKEFDIVMEHCTSTKFIALHDTNTYKGKGSRRNLTDNPDWTMSWADVDPTQEWAIFERR